MKNSKLAKSVQNKVDDTYYSGWVSIESNIMPDKCSEVVIMYKDKTKAVAFFDGDGRFYIEKTDCDVTCIVVKWHKLP